MDQEDFPKDRKSFSSSKFPGLVVFCLFRIVHDIDNKPDGGYFSKKNLVIGYNYGASTIAGPNVLVVRALNFTASKFTWFILRNSV